MLVKTIKVSDKGQIAIPQAIRDKMGVEKGSELLVIEKGGRLLLEKVSVLSDKMLEDFRDLTHFSEKSLRKIWDNPQDDEWGKQLANAHLSKRHSSNALSVYKPRKNKGKTFGHRVK